MAAFVQAQVDQPSDRDPAIGGPPGIKLTQARSNAALQYHAAWILLEPLLEHTNLSEQEVEAVQSGELPESYRDNLAAEQEHIELLIEATKLTLCDFGNQSEKGIGALLPHLSVMRSTGRMLIADAKRLEATDMDVAVERLAATIRLGEHASQSSYIIGSLVGVAIAQMAREEILRLLDDNKLDSEHAETLDDALNRIITDDPFHSLNAIESEAMMMKHWLKFTFTGKDAGKELCDYITVMTNGDDENSKRIRRVKRMNGEQLAKSVDEMALGYDDTIAAWQAEDPIGAIKNVEHRVITGEYGLVSELLLPALSNFRYRLTEAELDFKDLREQLQEVSKG